MNKEPGSTTGSNEDLPYKGLYFLLIRIYLHSHGHTAFALLSIFSELWSLPSCNMQRPTKARPRG